MTFVEYKINTDELNIECSELLEMLQVTDFSPHNPVVSEATEVFDKLYEIANIRGGYVVYDNIVLDKEKGVINIKDKQLYPQPQVCGYMKGAEMLAVFVCTAGEGFTEIAKGYNKEGEYLKGFIADTMGSLTVEKAMNLIQERIEREYLSYGLKITNRYSPGYCFWEVNDQQQLFSLLPNNPCNINLSNSCLMTPIKSVSGIIGIGKDVKKRGYACSKCTNKNCLYKQISEQH